MNIKITIHLLATTFAFAYSTISMAGSEKSVSIEPKESVVFAFKASAISNWFSTLLAGTKINSKTTSGSTHNSPVCHDSGGTPIYLASICQQLYPSLEVQPCKFDPKCRTEYPTEPCAGRQCIEPDPGP
jgi:hypothetical protein